MNAGVIDSSDVVYITITNTIGGSIYAVATLISQHSRLIPTSQISDSLELSLQWWLFKSKVIAFRVWDYKQRVFSVVRVLSGQNTCSETCLWILEVPINI